MGDPDHGELSILIAFPSWSTPRRAKIVLAPESAKKRSPVGAEPMITIHFLNAYPYEYQ